MAVAAPAAEPQPDHWAPLRFLIGEWTGSASGQAGDGKVTRRYQFIMGERFIQEINISRYRPTASNQVGEVHEHWSVFSYDKARKLIVLRQFHGEGFVNTYRQANAAAGAAPLVFESEAFENFSNSWKARETYEFSSDDEFIETFELAAPGKSPQLYSRNHFKRVTR